jgi:hypothetical protein
MRKGLRAKEKSLESFCTWISLLHLISGWTLRGNAMGGLFKPNGRGRGARALLEPRCGGTEGTEYQHISFKSSAGYVLIVYAFMYALLNGYLLCSEVNVIIYARSGALGGGRTHTWRILSYLDSRFPTSCYSGYNLRMSCFPGLDLRHLRVYGLFDCKIRRSF